MWLVCYCFGQVYENGYIGIGGTAGSSTPQTLPFSDSNGIVAPFWADALRSGPMGKVHYRETTHTQLMDRAMYEITLAYGGTVSITSLFIATWEQVGYAPNGFDKVRITPDKCSDILSVKISPIMKFRFDNVRKHDRS